MTTDDEPDSLMRAIAAAPAQKPPVRRVTVLVIRFDPKTFEPIPRDEVIATIQRLDGELVERGGVVVAAFWEGPTEPAARAASCALALRDLIPGAHFSVASGATDAVGPTALDALIESASTLLATGSEVGPDSAQAREASPAEVIGNYKIVQLLGAGGMGVVYLAEHVLLGRKAVVKFVQPEYSTNAEFVQRFFTEAKTASSIRHPGIVDVFDYGHDAKGRGYIVMEYLDGESLRVRLKRESPLPVDLAIALGIQLASALDAAHTSGVIHRDLKPDNVFLVADPETTHALRPKVLDFGLAKVTAQTDGQLGLTETGHFVGTPLYISPEQARSTNVDHRTDVYSLGCILFEMIAGRPPFLDKTVADLIASHLSKPAPALGSLLSNLPAGLEAAIARALAKDPDQRYATMAAFGADLAKVAGTLQPGGPAPVKVATAETVVARPRAREPVAAPKPTSRRVPKLGLALAACVLLGIGAFLALRTPARGLPDANRKVTIVVENAGSEQDAWMAPVITRLATRTLAEHDPRFTIVPTDQANVIAKLRYHRTGASIEIAADLGDGTPIPSATAPAITSALAKLAPAVRARLDDGQPAPADNAVMARYGTTSREAFRLYTAAVDQYFGSVMSDVALVHRDLEAALKLDPTWPHALALLAMSQGLGSKDSTDTLARTAATDRDPLGGKALEALRLASAGKDREVTELLDDEYRKAPDDALVGWILLISFDRLHRRDDWIAVVQKLHETHPDLQFGADLVGAMRAAGRTQDAERVLARWRSTAPEAEQLFISLIAEDLEHGRAGDAERRAQELVLVYGESTPRLAMLCDVYVARERTSEARGIALRLLREGPIDRARAHKRLGDIAVLEGRFAAAYESYEAAARESRNFGLEGGSRDALEALRSLSRVVERQGDAVSRGRELVAVLGEVGNATGKAVAEFEVALAERARGKCPDPAATLATIPAGPSRDVAQKQMLRAAAAQGCGTCKDVVAAGLAASEDSVRSLYELGVCAESEGQLELARNVLERIRDVRTWTTNPPPYLASPYHSILARYLLARVDEKLGQPDAAKRELESFLARWEKVDRPLPEVPAARAALQRLAK